jgi:hypothetical protein
LREIPLNGKRPSTDSKAKVNATSVFLAPYDETPDQTGKNEEGRREAPLVRFLLCRVALAALRGLSGAS